MKSKNKKTTQDLKQLYPLFFERNFLFTKEKEIPGLVAWVCIGIVATLFSVIALYAVIQDTFTNVHAAHGS